MKPCVRCPPWGRSSPMMRSWGASSAAEGGAGWSTNGVILTQHTHTHMHTHICTHTHSVRRWVVVAAQGGGGYVSGRQEPVSRGVLSAALTLGLPTAGCRLLLAPSACSLSPAPAPDQLTAHHHHHHQCHHHHRHHPTPAQHHHHTTTTACAALRHPPVYTAKLAGEPDSVCTLTPQASGARPNRSSARFSHSSSHSSMNSLPP